MIGQFLMSIYRARMKKASNSCRRAVLEWTLNRAAQLNTTNHHRDSLFNGTDMPSRVITREIGQDDLDVKKRPETMENVDAGEEIQEAEEDESENGRLVGQFFSESVANLSWRELSEEEVSLLSKGLKLSATPTDIVKA